MVSCKGISCGTLRLNHEAFVVRNPENMGSFRFRYMCSSPDHVEQASAGYYSVTLRNIRDGRCSMLSIEKAERLAPIFPVVPWSHKTGRKSNLIIDEAVEVQVHVKPREICVFPNEHHCVARSFLAARKDHHGPTASGGLAKELPKMD